MLTMNQAQILINSVGLVVIFGFVFCVIHMIMNHIFKMKAIQNGNAESEKYLMLRKQLITGLGVLIVFFLAALMFMGFLQGWNSASGVDLLINEHPHGRRNIINEVINVIRLLVIFSFVGIGLRFVFKYREQAEKLKSNGTSHKATNQDESKRQN